MERIAAIDWFNADPTARVSPAAVFCCPGEALRHGGKPRKGGDRYPGGQLKRPDVGLGPHPLTLEQRARVVGWQHALDEKSSTLLGQALLRRALHDAVVGLAETPRVREAIENRALARYDVLDDFVKLHRAVWGSGTAQSNLKSFGGGMRPPPGALDPAADPGALRRFRRMVARVLLAAVPQGIPQPLGVLHRVAFDEVINAAGQPDIRLLGLPERAALRLAADAMLAREPRAADSNRVETTPVAERSRASRFQPLFTGDRAGIDNADLLAAVERLRVHKAVLG